MHIYRRYKTIVLTSYIFLVLGLTAYFGYLVSQDHQRERVALTQILRSHSQKFDHLTQVLGLELATLIRLADALSAQTASGSEPGNAFPTPVVPNWLKTADNGLYFHGDALVDDPDVLRLGNITGLGTLQDLSPQAQLSLAVALAMNPTFADVAAQSDLIQSAFYWSAAGVGASFPWRPSDQLRFSEATLSTPALQQAIQSGTDDARPQKLGRRIRTQIEMDPVTQKPILRMTAGVGQAQGLVGVVGLTVPLADINQLNDAFAGGYGKVLIMGPGGEAIAHPRLLALMETVASDPPSPAMAQEVLRSHRAAHLADILARPAGQLMRFAEGMALHIPLQSVPWRLVYFGREDRLVRAVIRAHLPTYAIYFLLLTAFFIAALRAGRREFAAPLYKLIAQLRADPAGGGESASTLPEAWLPIRQDITKAVRERLQIERHHQSLATIRQLKQTLAASQLPQDPRFTIFADSHSADDQQTDFHDIVQLRDGDVVFFTGSVSGRGQSTTYYAVICHTILKTLASDGKSPEECLAVANKMLCQQKASTTFASALIVKYTPDGHRCRIAASTHTAPTLLLPTGAKETVAVTRGPALGVIDDMVYEPSTVTLPVGATLLLATLGMGDDRQLELGVEGTDRKSLADLAKMPPQQLVGYLLSASYGLGRQSDAPHPSSTPSGPLQAAELDATFIALKIEQANKDRQTQPRPRLVHGRNNPSD